MMPASHHPPAASTSSPSGSARDVFRYVREAIGLVWQTDRRLFVALVVLTVGAGLIPAAVAVVGKQIVDAVLHAIDTGVRADRDLALLWVGLEGVLVAVLAGIRRADQTVQSLLRVLLGHRVNMLIIDKARQLDLTQFEDSATYDRMVQARRGASTRPLGLVRKCFGLVRNGLSLVSYGALLLAFSPLAVLVLALSTLPAFFVETRFADLGFRLFTWRSPERRMQNYLEVVVSREDYAKEVKLLGLGPMLVGRYDDIFQKVFHEEAGLVKRRGFWGYLLGLASTVALYGAYVWIAMSAVAKAITLGEMTMYLMVFKQGQGAFQAILSDVGGMYEDNLYLSNLHAFLETPVRDRTGGVLVGTVPGDGVRFEDVGFAYPGAPEGQWALQGVDLHLRPGRKLALVGHNGSGKTTLIKLLTGLYLPTVGRIVLDGVDLREWDDAALRARVGVIFQDFVRYQFTVGENVGVGDIDRVEDAEARAEAAEKGMSKDFIEAMPQSWDTQLGRWFRGGQELSGGQWQKIALSRAFMRSDADILVLDEPTSAMDAEAEADIFARMRDLSEDKLAILISHRFSTVRMADEIIVLEGGRIKEQGTHEQLMRDGARYASLFELQARGYQ